MKQYSESLVGNDAAPVVEDPPPELETVGGAGTYPQGGMPMQQMGGIAPVPAHVAQSHAQGGAYMAHNAV